MKAQKDSVISFHYDLSDESNAPIESSRGGEPLVMLLGYGGIIAGVESALLDRAAGDRFQVTVPPEQGYGERREDAMQRVPKKYFKSPDRLKPGMQTVLHGSDGNQRVVTVRKVGSSVIDVDLNHPMAGHVLNFDIEVLDVRAASPEEIEHGHAHGPGGHQH